MDQHRVVCVVEWFLCLAGVQWREPQPVQGDLRLMFYALIEQQINLRGVCSFPGRVCQMGLLLDLTLNGHLHT